MEKSKLLHMIKSVRQLCETLERELSKEKQDTFLLVEDYSIPRSAVVQHLKTSLTKKEQKKILKMWDDGETVNAISNVTGRHHTTIVRFLEWSDETGGLAAGRVARGHLAWRA